MADMTFDGNRLTWGADSWPAVSGVGSSAKAPAGTYNVERRLLVPRQKFTKAGFNDPVTGQGFFVPITPTFDTGRTGLGIHPDGTPPGTEGCIGLKSDVFGFYDRIAACGANAKLTLQITG